MPAARNQSGMKTLAAVATPAPGVAPPIQRPIRRQSASSTKPPAMTLIVCIESLSVACRWAELRYVGVHNLPVAVPLLKHERNGDGRRRAELFRDLGGRRRWQNRGRVAEEARDCD